MAAAAAAGSEEEAAFTLSQEQLLSLSALFYGGRADADFERRDAAEIKRVLQAASLVGPFWALPTAA